MTAPAADGSGDDFTRLEAIFLAARDAAADERAQILDAECDDDAMRREVASLLAHHDAARADADTLDRRFEAAVHAEAGRALDATSGRRFGAYEILDVLGEGGMGIVYRARQANPEREVALKVIRAGFATPAMRRRFELESAVLGRLHHPGIAQIFEAGTADPGHGGAPQPYLAMELVHGPWITQYAAAHDLDATARIELLVQVCDAVHHAHQRGIIHRDLKPPNVVVDAAGRPRVLDFGVARVTDADVQLTTMRTDVGQLVGTLPYMSPEQAAGDPDAIDVRSDVYALGVLAFELLTGQLPYDVGGVPVAEAARVIRDDPPRRLSSVDRSLRGDLETIVATALEKEQGRRYDSAADLARDLRRAIAHEPIHARPASATYQLRKFARRNKALVGGLAVAFLLLVAAVVGTSIGMVRADRSAERAARASAFMQDMLTRAAPQLGGADIRLLDVADLAAATVHERFADDPLQEAAVRSMLADMYLSQGMWSKSLDQYTAAIELADGRLDPEDPEVLVWRAGRFECLSRLERRLEIRDEAPAWVEPMIRVLGPAHHATVVTRREVALIPVVDSDFVTVEQSLRALLRDIRPAGAAVADLLETTKYLARMLDAQGRRPSGAERREAMLDEAIALLEAVINESLASGAAVESERLDADGMLTELLGERGRYAASAARARSILDETRGRYTEGHPVRLAAHRHLAFALHHLGEHDEAADRIVQAVEGLIDTVGPRYPVTAMRMIDALPILYVADRTETGLAYATAVHDVMSGMSHEDERTARFDVWVAAFLVRLDRRDAAAPIMQQLMAWEDAGVLRDDDPVLRPLVHLVAGDLADRAGDADRAAAHRRIGLAACQAATPAWLEARLRGASSA